MGIDYSTHVGPYLACSFDPTSPPNQDKVCQLVQEALYPALGDQLLLWQKQHNIHLYLPNRDIVYENDECRAVSVQHNEASVHRIDSNIIIEQIWSFSRQFEKEIEVVDSIYGDKNVAVRWGIVHQVH